MNGGRCLGTVCFERSETEKQQHLGQVVGSRMSLCPKGVCRRPSPGFLSSKEVSMPKMCSSGRTKREAHRTRCLAGQQEPDPHVSSSDGKNPFLLMQVPNHQENELNFPMRTSNYLL